MTIKKFWLVFFLQLVVLSGLKWLFFGYIDYLDGSWQVLYFLSTAVLVLILVRLLGVVTLLEAGFIAVFWFFTSLALDLFVTAPLTIGLKIYFSYALWVGYGLMMVMVVLGHKKRHIQVRKEQAAHRHGHH
ncbi:MAG: hypothetical protein KGJ93_02175 [Patescibacteria group bacterium]|nr:hypothetical protein [Patescibacteria group bacterium]